MATRAVALAGLAGYDPVDHHYLPCRAPLLPCCCIVERTCAVAPSHYCLCYVVSHRVGLRQCTQTCRTYARHDTARYVRLLCAEPLHLRCCCLTMALVFAARAASDQRVKAATASPTSARRAQSPSLAPLVLFDWPLPTNRVPRAIIVDGNDEPVRDPAAAVPNSQCTVRCSSIACTYM